MHPLVLGNGFLGSEFKRRGYFTFDGYIQCFEELADIIGDHDIVINCIAKSNTRWCEDSKNFKGALFSNGTLVGWLSSFCQQSNKKLIHISTGCLYHGPNKLWTEEDFIEAHCSYTVTKWVGEKLCNLSRDLVVRPRLFFGGIEDRNNLLCKLPKFDRFLDVKNSFTSIHVLADAIERLIGANQVGLFNVACDGCASLKEMSEWIGLTGKILTEEELHSGQGLFLVSNCMSLEKLKRFYQPPSIKDEVLRCWSKLII